jgi:hypothetical protein
MSETFTPNLKSPTIQSDGIQSPQSQSNQQETDTSNKTQLEDISTKSPLPPRTNTKIFIFLIALVLSTAVAYFLYNQIQDKQTAGINSYQDCVAAGYPIMESLPRQCATPDGRTFTDSSVEVAEPQDQSEDLTADWKTYTNTYHDYSIRIPAGWKYEIINEAYGTSSHAVINSPDSSASMIIGTSPNDKVDFKSSAQHWMEFYKSSTSSLGNYSPELKSVTSVSKSGKEGLQYIIDLDEDGKPSTAVWTYFPLNSQSLLKISFQSHDSTTLEQFFQILSTFEFINE